jgi:serine/threonine protein kinase
MADYQGQNHIFDAGVRIGHGGMADVFVGMSRDNPPINVALKVPLPSLDPGLVSMFLREVDAAQKVSSPYIVPIVDWGDSPPFIAFEFMSEGTLAKAISDRQISGQRWDERGLIGMFHQLASGMSAINAQVIHRDLKPDNVFTDNGTLRISDFGIARFTGAATRSATFKGWGTPHYMAPETFRVESPDWKADQYSLGVVFYELATLQRPFNGDWDALERAHLYDRAPLVTTVAPDLSDRMGQMIRRMMEKRGEDRFGSWQEIRDELDAIENRLAPAQPPPDDRLARLAAQQMEQVEARRLAEQRQSDRRENQIKSREELVTYWAGVFFDAIDKRIEAINATLGTKDILFRRQIIESNRRHVTGSFSQARPLTAEANADFLNAHLRMSIYPVDIDASSEVVAWGTVRVDTNKRIWLGNILLLREPAPYGSWLEVDMRISGMISGNRVLEGGDGSYYVAGQQRIVLAEDAKGLLAQRDLRTTISSVNYSEKAFDLNRVLDELMVIFVEDAAEEKPPPPRPRNEDDDWPFGGGRRRGYSGRI